MNTPNIPNRRQRIPVPYTGPWSDEPHKAKAAAGLCYRLTCMSVADHRWRNTGMGDAKYCGHCVRLLNEHNPGLCVEIEEPDTEETQGV